MSACPECGIGGGRDVTHRCAPGKWWFKTGPLTEDDIRRSTETAMRLADAYPAGHPKRLEREQPTEAAYRCVECDRPWIVFSVEGEPSDGIDVRECRFCGADGARRIR